MLNEQEILLFQKLYEKHYGIILSKENAVKFGTEFINLIEALVGHPAERNITK